MRILIFFFLLSFSFPLFSQYKFDYTWLMGLRPSGPAFPQNCMNIMTFGGDSLKVAKDSFNSQTFVTNASISDDDGNLLFYSNGCYIKDANNQIMQNGGNLNPGIIYNDNCPNYGYTAVDAILIIPIPGNSENYFVFHQAGDTFNIAPFYRVNKLYLTEVDMALNNGLGEVTTKNQTIVDEILVQGIHAIKHANNEDWWIFVTRLNENIFYRMLLTSQGIVSTDTQLIGQVTYNNDGGQYSFTPDGKKLLKFDYNNQLRIFDFDRNTGLLSNYQKIVVDTSEFRLQTGLAISPNSRFAYVSMVDKLYQLDLEAADIEASRVLVGEFDGFDYQGFPVFFFTMRLGPDCRIYMSALSPAPYMHVINNPDEPGLACGFAQRGIELPCIGNYSIPNFPHYRLGTGYPVCDSSIVYVSSGYVPPPTEKITVWPNPASHEVHLENNVPSTKPSTLRLFNATGQAVRQWKMSAGQLGHVFSLDGLADGMYFWRLERDGSAVGSGKLVIVK